MSKGNKTPGGFRRTIVDAYVDTIPLIELNVVWVLLSLPLVTAPPAAGGLYYATNRLAHDKAAGWRELLQGFRCHFWLSWRWGGVNLLVAALLVANLFFYGRLVGESWSRWVVVAELVLLVCWLGLQLYTFPLLLEQEKPRLRTAWRNSAVIFLRRPLSSAGLFLGIILIAVISSLWLQPAWLFISGSLCAYLANRGALLAIATLEEEGKEPS